MEKEQRSKLQKATQDARRLLEEEFSRQLLETYDINVAAGRWSEEPGAHLQAEQRLLREKLLAWIEHRSVQINDEKEALLLALREMAFTALNRFVALKLMEARELVRPCVSGGLESEGFQEFTAVAQGLLVEQESSYRLYLETIFEDVSRELRALFDPRDPASLLWPKRTALLDLLDILNRPELAELWREDETLGWIYQYFNGDAERKKMREESSAPRNSRELAVRNQFFTPRYVVEFLTDNTLGRIWYEMRQGDTGLIERCRYLVRRPNEIWLQLGEEAPAEVVADEALCQEELLRQPVHIYRPLKDPREIRMLDPACGSMHFGLYAFDLYLAIYEEAWEISKGSDEQAKQGEVFAPFVTYAADFANKAAFLCEVPRLILLHNIHGVDIDPRATQIARLTLWLRAQRAWQEQGVEVAARPAITRSNVVCAEPMPGERELLADFVDQQFPEAERGLVQQLLEVIFDKMQLAGEAGSLLKIEEEIRDAIDQARREWKKLAIQQQDLFSAAELAALGQVGYSLKTDLQSLTKDFWIDIEERIYAALRHYAEKAETGGGFQRRFFAEDASQGFAFIDTCRKRYDVALMNPPFGDVSEGSKDYIFEQHTREKTELGACFVTRISQLLDTNSSLGIISNRTFLFAESFQEWRVLNLRNLSLCADLGFGVLDALVETAAFVLSVRSTQVASFVALTNSPDKGFDLSTTVREVCTPDTKNHRLYERHKSTFSDLGTEWFYYWLSERLLTKAKSLSAKQTGLLAKPGLQTCDNFRFVRLAWEVPKDSQFQQTWFRLSKGGEYQPFWADVHLVALWRDNGLEMKQFIENSYESWSKQIPSVNLYFLPGLTYSERTTSSLSLRIFPSGCLFDKQGPFVGYPAGSNQSSNLLVFLGISYCYLFKALVESQVGLRDATEAGSPARHYMPSMIERLPLPLIPHEEKQIVDWASASIKLHREFGALDTSDSMHRGLQDLGGSDSLLSFQNKLGKNFTNDMQHLYKGLAFSEIILSRSFNITKAQGRKLEGVFGPQFALEDPNQPQPNADDVAALLRKSEADLVQEAISRVGYFSSILKQSFVANRNVELAAICLAKSPVEILQQVKSFDWLIPIFELGQNVFDFWVGCAFGRWDIRYAMGGQGAPELPDPFAPLPVCPPGQLQNAHGLPARPEDVPPSYPVSIPWDGILVDDPNHRLDLERRIREVIEIIWTGKKGDATAESIEHEACYILGVKMVREYFRKPTGFFSNHLSRYSKSRRQAPIYWQLSAGGGSYSAWLYYHRFTQDTLYRVLGDFVEIRIQEAEREQFELESQVGLSGDAASLLQGLQTLLQDLRVFKSELELVAPLWNPNLNDGVIINHAILWRITPFTPWQKKCKECWDKLVKGDYDWAHLAFHLWPERVIRKCTTDRSLAIAHGLEERLWQETSKGNWLQHQVSEAELQALLAEYSKPAVQNALERFLAASPPVAAARTRAPRAAKSSSTGATRRPRGSAPEVDAETSRQTLLVLTASPVEGLGRNAIAELLDVEAASLTAVIKQLKEGGQIEQLGAARGAKYRLTEQGRAMVERGEES